jgi:predicted CXXCH cytochrome family protein
MAMVIGLASLAEPTQPQDMRQTAHDLRSRLALEARDVSAMCVFCHAPEGTRAPSAQAPGWQRSADGNGSFSMYAGPMNVTTGGAEIPGGSMICLSCHDASQAPGIAGGASDHPFGVPYAGTSGFGVGGLWQSATIDEQIRAHQRRVTTGSATSAGIGGRGGFRPPSQSVIDQRTVWWIPTSGGSTRRTRNDLPLYGGIETGSGPADTAIAVPTIECGTCHDPHTSTPMFLRIPNAGARLCLSCHDL